MRIYLHILRLIGPRRRAAGGPAWHRQDTARAGAGARGRVRLPAPARLRLRRDVRRGRGRPGQ
eukprot:9074445-Pyramimonas_sp.AAC.3